MQPTGLCGQWNTHQSGHFNGNPLKTSLQTTEWTQGLPKEVTFHQTKSCTPPPQLNLVVVVMVDTNGKETHCVSVCVHQFLLFKFTQEHTHANHKPSLYPQSWEAGVLQRLQAGPRAWALSGGVLLLFPSQQTTHKQPRLTIVRMQTSPWRTSEGAQMLLLTVWAIGHAFGHTKRLLCFVLNRLIFKWNIFFCFEENLPSAKPVHLSTACLG